MAERTRHETIGSETRSGSPPRWMWPAFIAVSAGFLIGLAIDSDPVRLVFKALPVLALAVGVFLTEPRTTFRRTMAIGLAFGAGGDLLLELGAFVPGLLSFLVGHVFYIVAFVRVARVPKLLLAVPYVAVAIGLTAFVAEGADELVLPVAVYAIVIAAMAWRAAALLGEIPARSAAPIAAGAALFFISDALIAIDRFDTEIAGAAWWIMLTYLAGQGLIALGTVRTDA